MKLEPPTDVVFCPSMVWILTFRSRLALESLEYCAVFSGLRSIEMSTSNDPDDCK